MAGMLDLTKRSTHLVRYCLRDEIKPGGRRGKGENSRRFLETGLNRRLKQGERARGKTLKQPVRENPPGLC